MKELFVGLISFMGLVDEVVVPIRTPSSEKITITISHYNNTPIVLAYGEEQISTLQKDIQPPAEQSANDHCALIGGELDDLSFGTIIDLRAESGDKVTIVNKELNTEGITSKLYIPFNYISCKVSKTQCLNDDIDDLKVAQKRYQSCL